MNQQPDKFFRDKLQNYGHPVSPAAWNRVSGNLNNKKHNTGLLLKVAAAALLLATATLLIYPSLHIDNDSLASANRPETAADTSIKKLDNMEDNNKKTQPARREESATPQATPDGGPQKHKPRKPGVTKSKTKKPVTQQPAPASQSNTVPADELKQHVATLATDVQQAAEQRQAPQAQTTERKNITIVFSAEEVNQKYLTKKQEADATAEQPQTSGLKKLLDKAYDLKHNQDLLGDLRQKKNEILAMNFRQEKETTQND